MCAEKTPRVRVMYFYDNTTTYICPDSNCNRWHIVYTRFEKQAVCKGCSKIFNVQIFPTKLSSVLD